MVALEKLDAHIDEIDQDLLSINELMIKSDTGFYAYTATENWNDTLEMGILHDLLEEESVPESERTLLGQYMIEMLQRNPASGMKLFADYLNTIVADPKYASLKEYHQELSEAAMDVYNTQEYSDYAVLYQDFLNDNSAESVAAKDAMKALNDKMQKWTA